MAPPPSKDALAIAIGRILFLRLSKEDQAKLFKPAGEKPDWKDIAHYTRQVVRTSTAAATIATMYVTELSVLNAALEPQMFLGGASMCVADLACYISLIAAMSAFPDRTKWALCSVSRWFDFMQHAVDALSPPASLGTAEKVVFNCNMPDRVPKVSELGVLITSPSVLTGEAAVVDVTDAPTGAAPAKAEKGGGKPAEGGGDKSGKSEAREKKEAEKKAKKEAKGDAAAAPAPPAADADKGIDISWAELRVGIIVDAKPQPDSDKLYLETIDLGEEKPRTVLSGLQQHLKLEEVKGAHVVCLCNLKARKIAGTTSQAMVLCCSKDGSLCFVTPPKDAKPGELVSYGDSYPGAFETDKKMDKKKAWEAIQPLLGTDDKGVCVYKGAKGVAPFTCKGGVCVATMPAVFGGVIS